MNSSNLDCDMDMGLGFVSLLASSGLSRVIIRKKPSTEVTFCASSILRLDANEIYSPKSTRSARISTPSKVCLCFPMAMSRSPFTAVRTFLRNALYRNHQPHHLRGRRSNVRCCFQERGVETPRVPCKPEPEPERKRSCAISSRRRTPHARRCHRLQAAMGPEYWF